MVWLGSRGITWPSNLIYYTYFARPSREVICIDERSCMSLHWLACRSKVLKILVRWIIEREASVGCGGRLKSQMRHERIYLPAKPSGRKRLDGWHLRYHRHPMSGVDRTFLGGSKDEERDNYGF